jgi:signal transduction histidine kinase
MKARIAGEIHPIHNQSTKEHQTVSKAKIYFPWMVSSVALTVIGILFMAANPDIFASAPGFNIISAMPFQIVLILIFPGVFAYEISRFHQQRKDFDQQVIGYESEITKLVNLKTRLQRKAQKHAGHADKLKHFITGQILDYIEYDEKFLHFKNIAAEVRHNGVICFDKVTSVLRAQFASETRTEEKKRLNDALEKMIYLWDLLDLSTTDNLSMYVANKIYESEEQYFRLALHQSESTQLFSPAFSTRRAVIKGLQGFLTDCDPPLAEVIDQTRPTLHHDDIFHIDLDDVGKLLGNENYIALVVENLVNNALYYFDSRKYGHKYSRIAITLRPSERNAELAIYGCGPTIDDAHSDQIYQLGFSTKRSKGNHGKGLGLYFVKQIVSGYEGSIRYENILNLEETYVIRFETTEGNKSSEIVRVTLDEEGKPLCRKSDIDSPQPDITFKLDGTVSSVEIAVQSTRQTFTLTDFDATDKRLLLDPSDAALPRWALEATSGRAHSRVVLRPLDIRGVRFVLNLPTAESRLEPSEVTPQPRLDHRSERNIALTLVHSSSKQSRSQAS